MNHSVNRPLFKPNRNKVLVRILMLLLLANPSLYGQNDYDIIKDSWLQYTDAPNFLYHYIAGQACTCSRYGAGS